MQNANYFPNFGNFVNIGPCLKYSCRGNRCTGTSLYSSSAAHTLYNVPNVVVVYYAAIATKRHMEAGIYNIQNTMAVTHILQTQEKKLHFTVRRSDIAETDR